MAIVLSRALRHRDKRATAAAITVLAGNELWNVAFFGRRSTRNGFYGIVIFAIAVVVLRVLVHRDRVSRHLVDGYLAWVGYDAWWTMRLWQLNPSSNAGHRCML
jgi:translocator protein